MIIIEPKTIIHYDDPQGRRLNLQKAFRRTIRFKMPADYHGAEIEPIEQDAVFVREQYVYEDNTSKLTDWHSDAPYWAHYDVPSIEGYRPTQTEVPQVNLTANSKQSAEVVISYEPDASNVPAEPADNTNSTETDATAKADTTTQTDVTTPTNAETRSTAQLDQRTAVTDHTGDDSLDHSKVGDHQVDMEKLMNNAMSRLNIDKNSTENGDSTAKKAALDKLMDNMAAKLKNGKSINDVIADENASNQKNDAKNDHSRWNRARNAIESTPQNSAQPAEPASPALSTPQSAESVPPVQPAPASASAKSEAVSTVPNTTASAPAEPVSAVKAPATKPFIKAWQAPRHAVLIPLSAELSYLRQTANVAETLNHLQELGYFYRQDNEYRAKTFAPVMP